MTTCLEPFRHGSRSTDCWNLLPGFEPRTRAAEGPRALVAPNRSCGQRCGVRDGPLIKATDAVHITGPAIWNKKIAESLAVEVK